MVVAAAAAAAAAEGRALLDPVQLGVGANLPDTQSNELSILWVLSCAFLVFFMQCGFAALEAGSIRQKNVKNILLKNVVDACIGTICWWAVGYSFAYGSCGQNGFIGASNFFASNAVDANTGTFYANWLFSWAFSATAATIVSGAVAERLQFRAYICYTTFISAWLYPLVVHWVWSSSGWLSAHRENCTTHTPNPFFSATNGLMDFAGSGVVHMVGGGAALMGAIVVGPRLGRFLPDGKIVEFEPASPSMAALGVFILWMGWYGFNAGSTGCFTGCMGVSARVAANTTLAVAAAALTNLGLAVFIGLAGDLGPMLNGVLAGAVAITAGCAVVQMYGAFIIGVIAAFIYTGASRLLLRLKIDDPLDAVPVHFACGAWGVVAVGFFATETSTREAYGYANDWGVFYGGSGKQLGIQVLGVVVIAAWSCTLTYALFYFLNRIVWLRVPREVENKGLDLAQGLKTGVLGKFQNKYTVVVESHLARASMAAPGGSGGPTLGKPADPYAAYAEHEHDEEEGHENNNDQHLS